MLNQITEPAITNTGAGRIARFRPITFKKVCLTIDGKQLINNIKCVLDAAGKTIIIGPNGAG